jgi:hypothetical protein
VLSSRNRHTAEGESVVEKIKSREDTDEGKSFLFEFQHIFFLSLSLSVFPMPQ